MPGPLTAWPSTYVPDGDAPSFVSVVFCVSMAAHQSPQPSPIPPDGVRLSALELAGPPVSRLVTPWPSSCVMISLSRSPSRLGEVELKMYICIRPADPSAGVEKFALLVP